MIVIDSNFLEGGGQIARTSVSLSVLLQKPVKLINIRAKRPEPGLKAQHLYAINALRELCNAEVKGLSIGSKTLEFIPGRLCRNKVDISIPTSGSAGLVLQALMPALVFCSQETIINFDGGGTAGKWSPPISYLINVFFRNLELFGIKPPEVSVEREGYYPKGGAKLSVKVFPCKEHHPASILEHSKVRVIRGLSQASTKLKDKKVAERQAKKAESLLKDYDVNINTEYVDTLSAGSCLTLWAECRNSVIGSDSLGGLGKPSEKVGEEASRKLLNELSSNAGFDMFCSDMIIPFIALTGGGFTASKISDHAKTNIWTVEKFLGNVFELKNSLIKVRKNG